MKVELIDHMGNDLSVIRAATVSFAKDPVEWDEEKHPRLLNYLARGMTQAEFKRFVEGLEHIPNHINSKQARENFVKNALEQYRHTPTHFCYDDKTEIITHNGWKLFKDLTDDDLVGQVDYSQETMVLSWVKPSHITREPFNGNLLGCKGTTVDYVVTPNHRMLLKPRTSKGWKPFEVRTALDVHNKDFKVSTTARLEQQGNGSYQEGLLYGFLLADGFVSGKKLRVRLKRQRKIKFLINLLNNLSIEFKLTTPKGVYDFSFHHELRDKIGTAATKKLYVDYTTSSTNYLQGIYDGYMQGDGSKKYKQYSFSSSSVTLFNDICFLASVLGYQPFVHKPRHFNSLKHNINYRGLISSRTKANTRMAEFYELPYNGEVYCVTVPTGMVMVRRNGVQLVSGNSPFTHCIVTLAMTAPIAIKAQCDKHVVGFTSNTESRRYISHPPELFLPTFRTKPDGSVKQGSGGEHPDNDIIREAYHALAHECLELYNGMIAQGVAAEQARFILPQGVETNWVWTGSLYAWARFYNLRTDPHAQKEIRNLAYMVEDVIAPLFPVSWKALTNQTEKTDD